MIKIFIGKWDYRYTLSAVLNFIKNNSPRELTYSTNAMVDSDVQVYVTKLFNKEYIREHSGELPEYIFVHIEEGLGIYVNGELVTTDELEEYIRGMQ